MATIATEAWQRLHQIKFDAIFYELPDSIFGHFLRVPISKYNLSKRPIEFVICSVKTVKFSHQIEKLSVVEKEEEKRNQLTIACERDKRN